MNLLKYLEPPVFDKVAGTFLFVAVAFFLILASSVSGPLQYDDAYNLQVTDCLSKGLGYSSYGALFDGSPKLFDAQVTTGPVILCPLAAVWKLSGGSLAWVRGFMLLFPWLLPVSFYILFKKHPRGFLVAALASSVSLGILNLQTGMVLGELPGSVVLILAACALAYERPLLAALLAGLSIQIKVVNGLAGVILLGSYFGFQFATRGVKWKTLAAAGALFAGPSLAFELYRLISFGELNGYLVSLHDFKVFVNREHIKTPLGWVAPDLIGPKIQGLSTQFAPFGWMTLAVGFALALYGGAWRKGCGDGSGDRREIQYRLICISLIAAGCGMLWGWMTQSLQPSGRRGLPFLSLVIPGVMALGVSILDDLWAAVAPAGRRWVRAFPQWLLAGWTLLAAATLFQSGMALIHSRAINSTLVREQQRVVEVLKQAAPQSLFVDHWWQHPEYLLLSGIPGTPLKTGHAQIGIAQDYEAALSEKKWEDVVREHPDPIYQSDHTVVFWMHEIRYQPFNGEVLELNPSSIRRRIGCFGKAKRINLKIQNVDAAAVGPLQVYMNGGPCTGTRWTADGEYLSAACPSALLGKRGSYKVEIRQLGTGAVFPAGYFTVK